MIGEGARNGASAHSAVIARVSDGLQRAIE
jgi:hypothetical protein